jgi:hypothetical protein
MDRAPEPLLSFLAIHEQKNLGFHSKEQLKKLSAINLVYGECAVNVLDNFI